MFKSFLPLALAASLAACATPSPVSVARAAEKADTDASLMYAAVATAANDYEAIPGADLAKAEALKLAAWRALLVERQAYDIGQAVNLTALTALVIQAKGLGH